MDKNLKHSHGKDIYNRQNQTNSELINLSKKVDANHRELKCEIRVINSRLDNLDNKVDRLETRMDSVENKIDNLEVKVDKTNDKLDMLIEHLIKTPKEK
jgi:peptidoglycan hydrolase CwlO-like protein